MTRTPEQLQIEWGAWVYIHPRALDSQLFAYAYALGQSDALQWVDCKKEMPEPFRTVIVGGGLASWTGRKWLSQTGADSGRIIQWNVTHWCALPQPPKADKEAAKDVK